MTRLPDTHAEAWDLLPWLANGRLSPADREWVEAHVQSCAACRAELDAQKVIEHDLRSAGAVPAPDADVAQDARDEQRSFDRLWARIEAAEAVQTPAVGAAVATAPRSASRTVRWLAAAVIVQGFGLALFGFDALRTQSQSYTTVTREAPARIDAPRVSLVFQPGASIESINTLLTHQGLSIVSGPGRSGNFTAALSADAVASGASAESVAAVISRSPDVAFAQPVAR